MLEQLTRLSPQEWRQVNAVPRDGTIILRAENSQIGQVPQTLRGYQGSGLYRDTETGKVWIIQFQ